MQVPGRRSATPATQDAPEGESDWQARLAELQARLDAVGQEKAALEGDRRQLQDRIAGLETISASRKELAGLLQAQLEAQVARIEQLERKLRVYQESLSWRVTRPLRGTVGLFNRAFKKRGPERREKLRNRPAPSFPSAGDGVPLPMAERYITTHPDLETTELPPLDVSVSVVIPTFNAGDEFYWLLRRLFTQKGLRSLEVVIVDSGSKDGTVSRAVEFGCKVVEIEQSQFSHSFARNLGAEHASGDLLLFMVQDAYPIGDHWLYGLARCLLHPRTESMRLSAVSCAEWSRVDSELLYDVLLHAHYEFLRCGDRDRAGRLPSSGDALELRKQGQLSDIACMISRAVFNQYRYRGSYAEDLTLGIDLIRDGHQVGLLSSIRVAHSHRRGAGYWVRRVFVDIIFLNAIFPGDEAPALTSATGVLVGAFALKRALWSVVASTQQSPVEALDAIIEHLRNLSLPATVSSFEGEGDFGYPPLGAWIDRLSRSCAEDERPMTAAEAAGARHMRAAFIDRLTGLRPHLGYVYPCLDEAVATEINDAIEKALAMTVGLQLAYCYLSPGRATEEANDPVEELKPLLTSGV